MHKGEAVGLTSQSTIALYKQSGLLYSQTHYWKNASFSSRCITTFSPSIFKHTNDMYQIALLHIQLVLLLGMVGLGNVCCVECALTTRGHEICQVRSVAFEL